MITGSRPGICNIDNVTSTDQTPDLISMGSHIKFVFLNSALIDQLCPITVGSTKLFPSLKIITLQDL